MHDAHHPARSGPLHHPSRAVRVGLWLCLYLLLALGCGQCGLVCRCTEGCACTRGCCGPAEPEDRRGCGCGQGVFQAPPDSVIRAQVSAALAEDATAASGMCGFETPGLLGVSTRRVLSWLSFGPAIWVEVEGSPRPPVATDAASVAATGAVTCIGTFLLVLYAADQGEWVLDSLDLVRVDTPGVDWEPPSSGGDWDWD